MSRPRVVLFGLPTVLAEALRATLEPEADVEIGISDGSLEGRSVHFAAADLVILRESAPRNAVAEIERLLGERTRTSFLALSREHGGATLHVLTPRC